MWRRECSHQVKFKRRGLAAGFWQQRDGVGSQYTSWCSDHAQVLGWVRAEALSCLEYSIRRIWNWYDYCASLCCNTLLVPQINQSIDNRVLKGSENVVCGMMCEWVAWVMVKSSQTAVFAHPSGHVTPWHLTSGLQMTTQAFAPVGWVTANEKNVCHNILNYLCSRMHRKLTLISG